MLLNKTIVDLLVTCQTLYVSLTALWSESKHRVAYTVQNGYIEVWNWSLVCLTIIFCKNEWKYLSTISRYIFSSFIKQIWNFFFLRCHYCPLWKINPTVLLISQTRMTLHYFLNGEQWHGCVRLTIFYLAICYGYSINQLFNFFLCKFHRG